MSRDIDIYIGIPFCRTKCLYCSFASEVIGKRDRLTPYLDLAASESATGGEPIVLAILKRAATLAGSDCGYGRIPLPEITPELDKKIGNMLEKVGLI